MSLSANNNLYNVVWEHVPMFPWKIKTFFQTQIRMQIRVKASLVSHVDMWKLAHPETKVRAALPSSGASADLWWDSARLQTADSFSQKPPRWSYLIGFKWRIDTRLARCKIHSDWWLRSVDGFYRFASLCVWLSSEEVLFNVSWGPLGLLQHLSYWFTGHFEILSAKPWSIKGVYTLKEAPGEHLTDWNA